jgi:hypothetical protein
MEEKTTDFMDWQEGKLLMIIIVLPGCVLIAVANSKRSQRSLKK